MKVLQMQVEETRDVDVFDLMHGYRVAMLAVEIARKIEMKMPEVHHLYTAGIFHDIGKSRVNREILYKPGKLSLAERESIKKHVVYGMEIGIQMELNEHVVRDMFSHHENYDGSGYPTGRKGEAIPIGGRILKICDVYDALRMNRSYRPAFSKKRALEIMESERNTFDPWIYELFQEVIASEDESTADQYCYC